MASEPHNRFLTTLRVACLKVAESVSIHKPVAQLFMRTFPVFTVGPQGDSREAVPQAFRVAVPGRRGLAHFSACLTAAQRGRVVAEKCACPLTAEGDSPIFAAAKLVFEGNVVHAAKIGTVPVNGYHFASTCFADLVFVLLRRGFAFVQPLLG